MLHPVTLGLLFLLVLFLIFLSGFFSSSETCMMSLNRYRLRHLARQGNRAAKRVEKLLERPDRLLSVILIGNTFANILASSLATFIAVRAFGDPGIVIATVLLTFIILIFAEIAPKTVAAMYPKQLAFAYSIPLTLFMRLIYPLVWVANGFVNGLLSLLKIRVMNKHGAEPLDTEELRTVVDASSEMVSGQSKDMLLGILDLNRIKVDEVMLPKDEVIAIDIKAPLSVIKTILMRAQHTRFPVHRGGMDDLLGVLNLRDALGLLTRNKLNKKALIKAINPPYYIPEGTSLTTQLSKFKSQSRRTAFIVDEYGDIQGMVTLEDILEEIVGELDSDVAAIKQSISSSDSNTHIVNGNVYLRELNKYMNWQLPITEAKTLNGLITDHLQHLPHKGDSFALKGFKIDVLAVKKHKVSRARITVLLKKKTV